MADNFKTRSEASGNGFAFLTGALVVLVAVLAIYLVFGPGFGNDDVVIRIDGGGTALDDAAQALGNAAGAVQGAVRGN